MQYKDLKPLLELQEGRSDRLEEIAREVERQNVWSGELLVAELENIDFDLEIFKRYYESL